MNKSVEDLASDLRRARERGQQIVPIVGAGLSADCGFPVIAAVVRYFGKLYSYIQLRGPVHDYREHGNLTKGLFDHHFSRYDLEPWRVFEDFGWPDRFQLNQDLYTKLTANWSRKTRGRDLIAGAVRNGLDSILPQLNQKGATQFSELHRDVGNILTRIKRRNSFKRPESQSENSNPTQNLYKSIDDRFKTHWSNSVSFDVIGDWRRLILYFTNYRSDYADALFARFGATRRPGQGHQFLAFLSKLLAVRTIVTFNFDSLIEEALEAEGIRCKVFAMEKGAGLPHQNLIRDQLSVIKAHGSTHALLLDEQLDRPLSREYLSRFDSIAGNNPVLLVVGCSADDRRLRDIVLHVLKARQDSQDSPSVAWLHYESTYPKFLAEADNENKEKLRDGTFPLRTNNPGATLVHLYSCLTEGNPASRVPYLAHVEKPIELASASNGSAQTSEVLGNAKEDQFDWIWAGKSKSLTTSQLLLKVANEWARNGYQFIWIDLESLHTFAGVVGSIIDQCRKYDPDLAPSLLPVDIDRIAESPDARRSLNKVIKSAAERVARALRRARYYLAIDGLDTYAWPSTTHHGLTHMAITRGAKRRVESMKKFLQILEKQDLGESRVGVGLDQLTSRYRSLKVSESNWFESLFNKAKRQRNAKRQRYYARFNPPFNFTESFSELREDLPIFSLRTIPAELKRILSEKQTSEPSNSECGALIAMVLFSLACFRRTRPLVATNYLLQPLLGEASDLDRLQRILTLFTEQGNEKERIWILQQLEGGSYWFNHSIRDRIYSENTKYTDTTSIRKFLALKAGARSLQARPAHRRNTVFQLFLGAITHHRISQIWYNRTFVQSRDTFAFLEYTYHRISSIRNLAKLRAFARVAVEKKDEGVASGLIEGIARCGELIRLINKNSPPFEPLGFGGDGPFVHLLGNYPRDSSGANWLDEVAMIQECLKQRHRRQLHGLYRGWTRAELILRTQVPAEQLLHWCEELLSDDLVHRCNRLVSDYRKIPAKSKAGRECFEPVYYNFGDETNSDFLIDSELEKDGSDIKEFRRFLQDLQVKLWIERSDYETCARHRRRHLWHSLGDKTLDLKKVHRPLRLIKNEGPIVDEIENYDDLIKVSELRQCHQLLNIVNCRLKLQQELTVDDKGLSEKMEEIGKLLSKIKERLEELKDSLGESDDLNEAWFRMLHLKTESEIGRVSMFSHDGFAGDPNRWKPKAVNVTAARKTITQALEDIGGRDVHTRAAPRSVILHPTPDASLFLQYRSVFHLFRGRTDWLTETEKETEGLRKALHSFEMARGGLDNDSPLISGLIEIYLAEAFLGQGRAVLFDLNRKKGLEEAKQIYDSAGGALRRARETLLASRHHLMWRKLFFRITTQYHTDRLLLRYAKVQETAVEQQTKSKRYVPDRYWEENAREALLRLRRAYQSLVSALDLFLPPPGKKFKTAKTDHSNRFRWLYRMWWEITLCGYATGRVVIKAVRDTRISDDQAHDYVKHQLRWLNAADGMNDSMLGPVIKNNYDSLKDHYLKSLKGKRGETPLMKALGRRRKLIELANKLSKGAELRKKLA